VVSEDVVRCRFRSNLPFRCGARATSFYFGFVAVTLDGSDNRAEMIELGLHRAHAPHVDAEFVFKVSDLLGAFVQVATQLRHRCRRRRRSRTSDFAGHVCVNGRLVSDGVFAPLHHATVSVPRQTDPPSGPSDTRGSDRQQGHVVAALRSHRAGSSSDRPGISKALQRGKTWNYSDTDAPMQIKDATNRRTPKRPKTLRSKSSCQDLRHFAFCSASSFGLKSTSGSSHAGKASIHWPFG
jgi:hypothetical protein